jgi:hypothetical protein
VATCIDRAEGRHHASGHRCFVLTSPISTKIVGAPPSNVWVKRSPFVHSFFRLRALARKGECAKNDSRCRAFNATGNGR